MKHRTWHNILQYIIIYIWLYRCLRTLLAIQSSQFYSTEAVVRKAASPFCSKTLEELDIREPTVPLRFLKVQQLPLETS